MADNLELYNKVRIVPPEAQKAIMGGRLRGMTDINPMWRIKTLTEQYGSCGFGWKYEITRQWQEVGAKDEIAVFVNINLFYKLPDGAWSEAVPGTGGSMFIAKEKEGLHTSDECYKMALTDALSVACKALGFGADVYWNKDSTKYDRPPQSTGQAQTQQAQAKRPPTTTPPVITTTTPPPHHHAEKPVDMAKWWAQVGKLGLGDKEVHDIAGRESLKGMSRVELTDLFGKCKVRAAEMKEGA